MTRGMNKEEIFKAGIDKYGYGHNERDNNRYRL